MSRRRREREALRRKVIADLEALCDRLDAAIAEARELLAAPEAAPEAAREQPPEQEGTLTP